MTYGEEHQVIAIEGEVGDAIASKAQHHDSRDNLKNSDCQGELGNFNEVLPSRFRRHDLFARKRER